MLRDRVLEHPEALIASCLVWVPIGIWIYALVSWMVQGDVDVLLGLPGICLSIGIGLIAMVSRDNRVAPLVFVASLLTLAAAPIVRSILNRRALNSLDVEMIERAYDALAMKRDNPGLKLRLAKALYNRGLIVQAIALGDDALQHLPRNLFEEDHRMVAGWKRARVSPEAPTSIACLDCGTENVPGTIYCQKCGAPYLLEYARGRWVGRGLARKAIAAWAAMMVGIVGIPWIAMSLPTAVALVAIALLVAAVVALLILAFKPEETAQAA